MLDAERLGVSSATRDKFACVLNPMGKQRVIEPFHVGNIVMF